MSLFCKLGYHSWNGCKCEKCGKIRDEHHSYEWGGNCKICSVCQRPTGNKHDWSKNCEECCNIGCGVTRTNAHDWSKDCCICCVCGYIRKKDHKLKNGECIICGLQIEDTFTDPRDNKKYKTVKILDQIWMAENLAFKFDRGCCAYENDSHNEEKYGLLYNREVLNDVCPGGWHIPSDKEWEKMFRFIGEAFSYPDGPVYFTAGSVLRSADDWADIKSVDKFSFKALPGGIMEGSSFKYLNEIGAWWSSDGAYQMDKRYDGRNVDFCNWWGRALSIRCVKD